MKSKNNNFSNFKLRRSQITSRLNREVDDSYEYSNYIEIRKNKSNCC